MLLKLSKGLQHLFYPQLCEGCKVQLLENEQVLCLNCHAGFPLIGNHNYERNPTSLRLAGRIPYIRATSLAEFTNEGILQHLLHEMKYNNKKHIGRYLGGLLGAELLKSNWNDLDYIVPVPLHPKKEALRGYNQSLQIANGIGKILGAKVKDDLLIRTRHTESQTNKTRTERVDNMKNAFRLNNKVDIKNKHILIVDDVLTTGSTIEACSEAIKQEISAKISIATIGIAQA